MTDIIFEWLNSPWIPGLLALGCFIYFAVTYYKANKTVNAYRREYQQRLVNAYAFFEMINSTQENVYWVGKSGLNDGMRRFVLPDDKTFPELHDGEIKICMCPLTPDSDIPSLGFAIVAENVYECRKSAEVQIYLRPASGAADKWMVTYADEDIIICENPFMGELKLLNKWQRILQTGDCIELISTVTPIKRKYIYENIPESRFYLLRYELL